MAIFYNEITALTLNAEHQEQTSVIQFNYNAEPILKINDNSWGSFVVTGTEAKSVSYDFYGNFTFKKGICDIDTIKQGGIADIGSKIQPIYLTGGRLTASDGTIGSSTKPIYLNSGAITASDGTVGSATKPIYINEGELTASDASVGSPIQPIFLNRGVITASYGVIGSSTQPIYLQEGEFKEAKAVKMIEYPFTIEVHKSQDMSSNKNLPNDFHSIGEVQTNIECYKFANLYFVRATVTNGRDRCQANEALRLTATAKTGKTITAITTSITPFDSAIVTSGPEYMTYQQSSTDLTKLYLYYVHTDSSNLLTSRCGTCFSFIAYIEDKK